MDIIVTDDNRAMWQSRLDEAEGALHKLLVGQSATAIGYDGESVSYKPANIHQLQAYIARMRAALGLTTRGARPAARKVLFGGGFR